MKVRIGNDIRLNLTLRGPKNYDDKNVKELHCYLINTSVTKCFGRDPFCHMGHDKVCGMPSYHVKPHCFWNTCDCRPCHKKYPHTPCDPAFGIGPLPPKYEPHCCCDKEYCRYGHMDPRSNCFGHHCAGCFHGHLWDEKPFDNIYFSHCCHDFVAPHFDEDFRYLAPSKMMAGKNKIQTYFPAQDQFMCGNYKLVVVMVVYETGWGRCDLHTYTVDYGTVVTLVDDDSAIDGDITIDVDNDQLIDNNVINLYTNPSYTMFVGDNLNVGDKDYNGQSYKILVTLANGGQTEYDPEDWSYGTIKFYSDNPDVVKVDEFTGRLYAMPEAGGKETTINFFSGEVNASFNVKVVGKGSDYIVFSDSNSINDIYNLIDDEKVARIEAGYIDFEDGSRVYKYKDIFGTHDLQNPKDGNYLWICSRKRIADSNSMQTYTHVRSSMFDVPLNPAKTRSGDNLYYYQCPNSLINTGIFDITVEP